MQVNNFTPTIIAFCCNWCSYAGADLADSNGRILVFLKPCDTYSFNQLLTEHRFEREKVYAVAVPCEGMLSTAEIKKHAESIVTVRDNGNTVSVSTLYDGDVLLPRA